MTYRVYTGPRGSKPPTGFEKDRALYKEYSNLDEALAWAHHVSAAGGAVHLIESDDGTVLTQREIANALHHSERELSKAPSSS
jgi:hypothetical protein